MQKKMTDTQSNRLYHMFLINAEEKLFSSRQSFEYAILKMLGQVFIFKFLQRPNP